RGLYLLAHPARNLALSLRGVRPRTSQLPVRRAILLDSSVRHLVSPRDRRDQPLSGAADDGAVLALAALFGWRRYRDASARVLLLHARAGDGAAGRAT